jgi:hypothetical protein
MPAGHILPLVRRPQPGMQKIGVWERTLVSATPNPSLYYAFIEDNTGMDNSVSSCFQTRIPQRHAEQLD